MQKTVTYNHVHLDGATLRRALDEMERVCGELTDASDIPSTPSLRHPLLVRAANVTRGEADWRFDSLDEFLADYVAGRSDPEFKAAFLSTESGSMLGGLPTLTLTVTQSPEHCTIAVSGPDRGSVERIHAIVGDVAPTFRREPPAPPAIRPRIFIGHGGSSAAWRELADHLRGQHGLDVVAYETGSRSGHSIRDILDEMLQSATFAVLVMTAEDEQADGNLRARQNVIHEAGLFQGRLGFARAIVVLQEGVEMLSNLAGIQYVPFSTSIREAQGEVLGAIRREFGPF